MAKRVDKNKAKVTKAVGPENNILHTIALAGLGLLLFLPPFFQGLFFAPGQQKALFFAILVFWLVLYWKWSTKNNSFFSHPLDYFMLALPFVYVISSFNAVNYGLAVDAVVKSLLCFIVYWITVQLARSRKDIEIVLWVIYTSAVMVALTGLMAATEIIYIKDGVLNGRLASSLQYPNALASYMAAVLALGSYLWWKYSHKNMDISIQKAKLYKYISFLIAIGNFLLLALLIGAKSNGGFIVFVLGVLMVIAFLPRINRLLFMIHLAIITVPAAGSIYLFLNSVKDKHAYKAWLWVGVGIILAAGLQWIYLKIVAGVLRKENMSYRLLVSVIVLVVIMCLVVSLTFADELKSLIGNFKLYSLMHRVYFMEDAFNMLKERPVLGWGGGGWQEAYQSFQSYSYISREVHSHYLQVAVETGMAGLMILMGIWSSFLLAVYRVYRKYNQSENVRVLIVFVTVLAMIFGIHALVDFDLSMAALSLVLFVSMALIRNIDSSSFEQEHPSAKEGAGNIGLTMAFAVGFMVLILLIPLLAGQSYLKKGTEYYGKKDIKGAITYIQKAAFYDPLHVDYHLALSDLYRFSGQLDSATAEMSEALLRSKYNPDIQVRLSNIALQREDFENAVRYAEKSIEMAPWQIVYYEYIGTVYKSAGLSELQNKKPQEADKYFSLAINLPKRIQEKRNSLDSFKQKYSNSLVTTPKIALTIGVSEFLLGNTKEASVNLKKALGDKSIKGEAYVWLSLLSEKQGALKLAEKYLNEAKKVSPQMENSYQELRQLLQ